MSGLIASAGVRSPYASAILCEVARAAFALLFGNEPEGDHEVLRFLQATTRHLSNEVGADSLGELLLLTNGELDAVMAVWIAAETNEVAERGGGPEGVFTLRDWQCHEMGV